MNVSRETLQNTAFLRQIKQIVVRRLLQIFTRIADEDPEKFAEVQKVYGNVLKLGSVEDLKNRDKLIPLTRFATNQRNSSSLDEVCTPLRLNGNTFSTTLTPHSIWRTRRKGRNRFAHNSSTRIIINSTSPS